MSKAISRNEDIINELKLNFDDEQEYLDEDYSESYTEDEEVPAEQIHLELEEITCGESYE